MAQPFSRQRSSMHTYRATGPSAAVDLHVLDTIHAIDLAYRPGIPLSWRTYVAGDWVK